MENTEKERVTLPEEAIYKKSREEILADYQVDSERGLEPAEAAKRLAEYGKNRLEEEKKVPLWQKLLDQFKDFMIIILIVAALISGVLGEWVDALLILGIVILNAILGVVQEGRAEKAIEALQKMSAPSARILRGGQQSMIPAEEIVPGDIVILEAGDIVPADLRLLKSSNLKAEESSLTGESVPVEKDAEFSTTEDIGLGDRVNLLFSGTSVTYGTGTGVVTGTGANTEVGKIADRLRGIKSEETPLQVSLNQLGKMLGIVCIIVCVIVFVVGLIQGGEALKLFLTSISLAVAAIPEGLPAVVTIVLALGMNRMASENAIVKRLLAVETLGSIDTICSDKTGTLTQNEMTVTRVYTGDELHIVEGTGYEPKGAVVYANGEENADRKTLDRLYQAAVLCNEAELVQEEEGWSILGDPTEGALLTLAAKEGVTREQLKEQYRYEGDLPFDSTRKRMSVFYSGFEEGYVSLTKGAPDLMLALCDSELRRGETVELTAERRQEILAVNSQMARGALRVLAYAYKVHPDGKFENPEEKMTFIGLTGMIDPARPEARDAIQVCIGAGIRCVMITGDYAETALAIAKDLHIAAEGSKVVSGTELDNMSDEELKAICDEVSVYARVSPEHKVRIVSALRERGHSASMTGDGVNDAPALKQADIGVAMGITGTEVAKGSADMILTDDNFATIVSAVREGRIIYKNIRKFVGFLLSCNVGEILVIFLTNILLGPNYTPLLPIQLLWLNLVTDSFPALALGQEKGEADIMNEKPRSRDERIINNDMIWSIVVQAVAIFLTVFVAFQVGRFFYPDYVINEAGEYLNAAGQTTEKAEEIALIREFHFTAADHGSPSDGARTFSFLTLITAELFRAFSSRSEKRSVFKLGLFTNRSMNKSIVLAFALMLVILYVPGLNGLFHIVHPSLRDWGLIIPLALFPFVCGELYKVIRHRND